MTDSDFRLFKVARKQLNAVIAQMAVGETRLDPVPGIASATRLTDNASSWKWSTCAIHGLAHWCPEDRSE